MSIVRILSAAALAAVCALTLAQAPARADDASDLLAKHKAFVGWQYGDGTFKSLQYTGTLTNPKDGVLDTSHVSRMNALYRGDHVSPKGRKTSEGFTGRLFWESNENGFTRPVLGDAQKYYIAEDVLFNESTTLATGKSQGSKTIDGQSYTVVRISTPGDSIDLYIDPQTGAYRRAVIDPDGSYESSIDILAYAEVLPGKKFVSKWKYTESSSTHEFSKFIANGAVTAADLHPPAQTATWDFANPSPFKIKVTDQRVILDAKVNGVAGRFIMDTGADGIVLTQAFADRAHAKQIDTGSASGIGPNEAKIRINHIDTLELGGNTLSNVVVQSFAESLDDEAPDGFIGFDLFAGAIVGVETDAATMTISDPSKTQVDKSQGVPAIVDLTTGQPSFPMKINGSIDVNATMDSGNTYYVLFGKDLVSSHHLRMLVDNSDIGYLQSHIGVGGVGGYEVDGCGHLDSIALGPIVYQNAPACESASMGARSALLGFDFFKAFNYVFDYPEATIILIPHKN